jgi:sugar lactone lactonase YvrE
VPGTEFSGDNGVVVSPDSKWAFVAAWGTREIYRVPVAAPGERSRVKVEFRPDNLRRAPDGKIFVTGQFIGESWDPSNRYGWATVRLDPQQMTVTPVIKEAGLPECDLVTSTVQIGETLWFSSVLSDRVAYRAAPSSKMR